MKFLQKTAFFGILFNTLFISQSAYTMLRRLAPQAAQQAIAATLVTSQRALLSGQENHPLWIKANQKIQDFLKENNATLTADDIKTINQGSLRYFYMSKYKEKLLRQSKDHQQESTQSLPKEKKWRELLNIKREKTNQIEADCKQKLDLLEKSYATQDFETFFKIYDDIHPLWQYARGIATEEEMDNETDPLWYHAHRASTPEEKMLEKEIKELLIKHNIHPDSIRIEFMPKTNLSEITYLLTADLCDTITKICCPKEYDDVKGRMPSFVAHVRDDKVLTLSPIYSKLSKQHRIKTIEHEICHIIMKDNEYGYHYARQFNDSQFKAYILLFEKRADIHSAIQSLENARHCYVYLNDDEKQEVIDYHKKSTNENSNSTKQSYKFITEILIPAIIVVVDFDCYLKYKKNNDKILCIQKNQLDLHPSNDTIWQTIEEKTNNRINRDTHTYSIVDCETDWKITFTTK